MSSSGSSYAAQTKTGGWRTPSRPRGLASSTKDSPTTSTFGPPPTTVKDEEGEADKANFELKMRIFYLEEKLSKVSSDPGADAAVVLSRAEQEADLLKREKEGLEEEVRHVRRQLEVTEEEALELHRRLNEVEGEDGVLSTRLGEVLKDNNKLKDEVQSLRVSLERSLTDAEAGRESREIAANHRAENQRLTNQIVHLQGESAAKDARVKELNELVKSLRASLASAADRDPEDTPPTLSDALKLQLDQYQANARRDAETIEAAAERVGELEAEKSDLEATANNLRDEVRALTKKFDAVEMERTDADTSLTHALGLDPSSSDLRSVLEVQGSMAARLAEMELESDSLSKEKTDMSERCRRAESRCEEMAKQLNLIKTSSEEVAALEAEEIARLEGELIAARSDATNARAEVAEADRRREKDAGVLRAEGDELRKEVLRLKREGNERDYKIKSLSSELDQAAGYSGNLEQKLHSVSLSSHAGRVLGKGGDAGGVPYTVPSPYHTPGLGYFTGVPAVASTPAFPPSMSTTTGSVMKGALSTDLELLYIQREKELLGKLAETMQKVRTMESSRDMSINEVLEGGGKRLKVETFIEEPKAVLQQSPQKTQEPQPKLSPKRNPSSRLGLHQPTLSSLQKTHAQQQKKRRNEERGVVKMLRSGAGTGGGAVAGGNKINRPEESHNHHNTYDKTRTSLAFGRHSSIDLNNGGSETPLPFDKGLRGGEREKFEPVQRREEPPRAQRGLTEERTSRDKGVTEAFMTSFPPTSDWATPKHAEVSVDIKAMTPLDKLREKLKLRHLQ